MPEAALATGPAPQADAPIPELPKPQTAQRATRFQFDHQVFSVKGAWFGIAPTTGDASYNVPLGDVWASLGIDTLAASFKINKDSTDAAMLQAVKKGLKFVREIRPGDSIPSEILDGTASWRVEPHHRDIAYGRITLQLASWISGKPLGSIKPAEIETMAAAPETKARLQEAFEVAAEKLGFGRDRKQEVIDQIEYLAREMAYIEALRERYGKIRKLLAGFALLQGSYKREQSILEELTRIRVLTKKPIDDISAIFDQIDGNTGEILNTLKTLPSQIRVIRESRDTLHQRFMLWDDPIEKWEGVPLERSGQVDQLIRVTYRFVARYFSAGVAWGL